MKEDEIKIEKHKVLGDLPKSDHVVSFDLYCNEHSKCAKLILDKMRNENHAIHHSIRFFMREEKDEGQNKIYYIVYVVVSELPEDDQVSSDFNKSNNKLAAAMRLISFLVEKLIC